MYIIINYFWHTKESFDEKTWIVDRNEFKYSFSNDTSFKHDALWSIFDNLANIDAH